MIVDLTEYEVGLVVRAEKFATEKHKGQKYGEHDYVCHLEGVVHRVILRNAKDITEGGGNPMLAILIAIAWLHDVMEDCGVTYKELVDNFGVCIADAVLRLTKHKGVDYNTYMVACCESALAREVKICDTLANLNESFNTHNEKGMKKYPTQLAILVAGTWAGKLVFLKEEE